MFVIFDDEKRSHTRFEIIPVIVDVDRRRRTWNRCRLRGSDAFVAGPKTCVCCDRLAQSSLC